VTTATTIDAEVGVLGAVLLNPSGFGECNGLKGEHFTRPQHQIIWETAKAIHSRGDALDATILAAELAKTGNLNRVGGAPYIHTLISSVPTATNVSYYARITHDAWKLRCLEELGDRFKLVGKSADPSEITDALETARRFLDEAEWADASGKDDFDSVFKSWVDWYETESVAIPTPWQGLSSALLGGWHPGRMYMVTGRPGAGKSALSLNAVLHAARCGYKSRVFSLEMPKQEVLSRFFSAGTGVPLKSVFTRRLNIEDRDKVERFAAQPFMQNISVNDSPTQTIESVMAECRMAKARGGLDMVVVDHTLLLEPSDKRQATYMQASWISKQAKLLARKLDVAVILCHQMNRASEYETRKPRMSDLREGGEADADVVMAMTRSDDGITAWVLKNRMGRPDVAVTLADELRFGRLA